MTASLFGFVLEDYAPDTGDSPNALCSMNAAPVILQV